MHGANLPHIGLEVDRWIHHRLAVELIARRSQRGSAALHDW